MLTLLFCSQAAGMSASKHRHEESSPLGEAEMGSEVCDLVIHKQSNPNILSNSSA